jgi:heavy metal sensor kinase
MKYRLTSTVRVRLTVWYVGAMLLVLAVYAAGVVMFVTRSASQALDERIRSDFRWAAEMWEQRPDGSFTWFEGDSGDDSPWLQVWSPTGQLLYRTTFAEWYPISQSARLAAEAGGDIVAVPSASTTFRVLSRRSKLGGQPVVIQVARSEAAMRQEFAELMLLLALGLPFAAAVATIGGYSLTRRTLAPVKRMAERARSITADRLSDRLPVDNPRDEFGQLASVFNDTLNRLESAFSQMQRFTSDVSHELRTPLTAIRSVGEVGLRQRRDESAYREIIGSMLEEVDRLACLIEKLLTLSRIDSGQAKLSMEVIDVGELAGEVIAQLGVLAEEKGQSIEMESVGHPQSVGDRVLLRHALTNVVDNAIKYSPDGGRIDIRVSASPTRTIVDVSDTGPGIVPSREAHIFDRFYRGAPSGSIGGVGLGLSIAKWAVQAIGGELKLETTHGSGCTFRITLPAPGAAADCSAPASAPAPSLRLQREPVAIGRQPAPSGSAR